MNIAHSIHRTSILTGSLGALLSPIPLADEIVFLPIYALMARRIGREHGLGLLKMPWRPISRTTLNGLMARAALNLAVSLVPGVAAVANAASAVVLTEMLGSYVDQACMAPAEAKALGLDAVRTRLKDTLGRFKAGSAQTA